MKYLKRSIRIILFTPFALGLPVATYYIIYPKPDNYIFPPVQGILFGFGTVSLCVIAVASFFAVMIGLGTFFEWIFSDEK